MHRRGLIIGAGSVLISGPVRASSLMALSPSRLQSPLRDLPAILDEFDVGEMPIEVEVTPGVRVVISRSLNGGP